MSRYLSLLKSSSSVVTLGSAENEKTHLIGPKGPTLPSRTPQPKKFQLSPRKHLRSLAKVTKRRRRIPPHIFNEQVVPMLRRTAGASRRAAECVTLSEPILLRMSLLSPFPGDAAEPLARSCVDAWSYGGGVRAEIYRLCGAETHAFRLVVMARKQPVTVVLPVHFRGTLTIRARADTKRGPRVSCSPAVRRALMRGDVRFGGAAEDGEDEVAVHTRGRVTLVMMDEEGLPREEWFRRGGGWLWRRRVRA